MRGLRAPFPTAAPTRPGRASEAGPRRRPSGEPLVPVAGERRPAPGSRVERIYRHLKTAIVSTRVAPSTRLSEQDVAVALGTSRTPVREAIRRLEQEGLVVRHPYRGVMVAPLSMTDVAEIWQLREILEPAACRLAAARADRAKLGALARALTRLDVPMPRLEHFEEHHRVDVALHRLIAGATRKRRLQELLDGLLGRLAPVRLVNSPERFHRARHEHLAIVAARQAGDGEAAAHAMRAHLTNALASLSGPT